MCERTQRPGSGRINIGATFLQTLTDLTRSMQISIGRLKTCSRTKRPRALKTVTKKTKGEFGLSTELDIGRSALSVGAFAAVCQHDGTAPWLQHSYLRIVC